ncbi:Rhombosortase [Rubrivivax sp. A210]|uniref:rhombosortase n=1 Tax=Rubrivivax sp. A210 TaxID=2772301 RepID=UPI00191AC13C|nr:rhombosortase [Rubrivivax sp. A210]CAD5373114.1 Rhombosortase [Rubrivivax sp. A210]
MSSRSAAWAWATVGGALMAGSLLALWLPAAALDWQPALAASEPWRAFSAAFVHWSPLHLGANLAGCAVVVAYGRAARTPAALALAWLAAWPLSQLGLLAQPALAHYGGASGVLHAGVAVATLGLLVQPGRARLIGGAVALGLVAKIVLEEPWGPPLRTGGGWDIAVAPLAHASGALAGLACGGLALILRRRPQGPGDAASSSRRSKT